MPITWWWKWRYQALKFFVLYPTHDGVARRAWDYEGHDPSFDYHLSMAANAGAGTYAEPLDHVSCYEALPS